MKSVHNSIHVLTWDWKEEPDFDELARIVLDVSGGTCHIHFVDTESDQIALAIANTAVSDDEAREAYEKRFDRT